jgi:hypothetical protein
MRDWKCCEKEPPEPFRTVVLLDKKTLSPLPHLFERDKYGVYFVRAEHKGTEDLVGEASLYKWRYL